MRWAGHAARTERGDVHKGLSWGPQGKRPLGRLCGRSIKVGWGAWTGLIWPRIGTDGGLL
jgi:hypothetical protein